MVLVYMFLKRRCKKGNVGDFVGVAGKIWSGEGKSNRSQNTKKDWLLSFYSEQRVSTQSKYDING